MEADDQMMIDSSDVEDQPPQKRAKFFHIFSMRKRYERDVSEAEHSDLKRAKKSMPIHDRPEFFHTDVVSKRRKIHADLNLHPKPKHRNLHRSLPLRNSGRQHSKPPNIDDGYQSSLQEDIPAKAPSDISQSNDREDAGAKLVADDEMQKRYERRKAADEASLKQRVDDRLRQHRNEEDSRGRLADLKLEVQSRVHEEISRRAAGKSPVQLLMEFCGIRSSADSRDSLKKAYRRALAQVHPDRMQQKPLEQVVEAEEIYKLLQPIYCEL